MADEFQETLKNLAELGQTLSEAPREDISTLTHQDVCMMFLQSQALHRMVGLTIKSAIERLQKFR